MLVIEDGRRFVCRSRSHESLALGSGDNVFEKRNGNKTAIDAQLKIFFLQPVDELALLIKDSNTGLDQFGIDPYDFILLTECDLANEEEDQEK
jgi:hypothetical protein